VVNSFRGVERDRVDKAYATAVCGIGIDDRYPTVMICVSFS
jgi:hypothetical protein